MFGRWIGLLRRQGFTGFKFCWWGNVISEIQDKFKGEISNFAIFENVGMWIWGIWVAMQCWASSVRWTYSSQLALVKISYTWAVLKKGAISISKFWSEFWKIGKIECKNCTAVFFVRRGRKNSTPPAPLEANGSREKRILWFWRRNGHLFSPLCQKWPFSVYLKDHKMLMKSFSIVSQNQQQGFRTTGHWSCFGLFKGLKTGKTASRGPSDFQTALKTADVPDFLGFCKDKTTAENGGKPVIFLFHTLVILWS